MTETQFDHGSFDKLVPIQSFEWGSSQRDSLIISSVQRVVFGFGVFRWQSGASAERFCEVHHGRHCDSKSIRVAGTTLNVWTLCRNVLGHCLPNLRNGTRTSRPNVGSGGWAFAKNVGSCGEQISRSEGRALIGRWTPKPFYRLRPFVLLYRLSNAHFTRSKPVPAAPLPGPKRVLNALSRRQTR
jgi:hypothetical protein